MEKPERHILVCGSFRASGESQGVCHRKGSIDLIPYLESELADRGMGDVAVSMTGCLKVCDRGPAMVIYPDNLWYGGVESEDDIDAILDALEEDSPAEEYLLC
ncbi:(2Fe-2S) ferredoxin domain-containing protein [Marispirochaeta sp.]|jgi:(2Fe-2S) ferredoxin|uniref:(2Fe-2S) ferredoxin domain-containing protein n=1 Tax=Marispirochaeta sp. TaxID=2038653 RepID=UPI0029C9A227|nr:(2Fe-2S) ferredoxin domain-containing protein [Marispirochaeta sp.]